MPSAPTQPSLHARAAPPPTPPSHREGRRGRPPSPPLLPPPCPRTDDEGADDVAKAAAMRAPTPCRGGRRHTLAVAAELRTHQQVGGRLAFCALESFCASFEGSVPRSRRAMRASPPPARRRRCRRGRGLRARQIRRIARPQPTLRGAATIARCADAAAARRCATHGRRNCGSGGGGRCRPWSPPAAASAPPPRPRRPSLLRAPPPSAAAAPPRVVARSATHRWREGA